jgi:hypothetical protein
MRVCHPGPVAFHFSMVVGGSLKDKSLRGFSSGGRPLRTSFFPSYWSAPASHASVISGTSSVLGEIRADFFRFAFMAMPHADNAPGRTTWGPDKCNQSFVEPPDRHKSRLSIVVAVIYAREVTAGKDFTCAAHIQPAFQQRLPSLGRIAGDAHVITVATLNTGVKTLCANPESAG